MPASDQPTTLKTPAQTLDTLQQHRPDTSIVIFIISTRILSITLVFNSAFINNQLIIFYAMQCVYIYKLLSGWDEIFAEIDTLLLQVSIGDLDAPV